MTTLNINNRELSLNYASASFSGYGHKEIEFGLEYNGIVKTFKFTTTNLEAVDNIKEKMDLNEITPDEKYLALYNIVEYYAEDAISEWIEEIDDQVNNKA